MGILVKYHDIKKYRLSSEKKTKNFRIKNFDFRSPELEQYGIKKITCTII